MSTSGAFDALARSLATVRYPIESVVFKQRAINLDGYTFKHCAFFNCALSTSNGNFALEACFLGAGTTLTFGGNAVRAVRLASLLDWGRLAPGLRAEGHPDGTVTIK